MYLSKNMNWVTAGVEIGFLPPGHSGVTLRLVFGSVAANVAGEIAAVLLVMLLFKLITLLFSRHHRKKSLESCLEKG
jgi:hypothetical protein